jgi:putative peptidoglycan lipid II flippase
MVFFTVISALFTGILQARRHFTAPAFAWLVYNFGIIGGAFVGGTVFAAQGDAAGLRIVCQGVLVGAALLVVVQLPAMWLSGFRYRPALDLKHPGVREVLRLFLPNMAGLAFTQLCLLWLPSFFGSFFARGAITSLRYANRLVVLPLGLFGIAISTATFPVMAERIAAGEVEGFKKLFSGSLRAVFFLAVPSAALLVVLAGPILRLLWRSGRFDETAVSAATFCLVFYAFALIGLSGLQIVNRAFYSLKDTVTPPVVGVTYTVLIVALTLGLKGTGLQYAAIAAATSVGATVGMILMFEILRRRLGGVEGGEIARSFMRVALASLALAAVAFYVSSLLGQAIGVPVTHFAATAPLVSGTAGAQAAAPTAKVALQVLVSMAAGLAAYLLVLRLVGAPEIESFRKVWRQRRARPAEG